MTPQLMQKNNKNIKNVTRAAKIIYLLKINGFTQAKIADELNISKNAVSRSIYGLSKISRVDSWIKENLGI